MLLFILLQKQFSIVLRFDKKEAIKCEEHLTNTRFKHREEFMSLGNGCLSSQTWQSINPIKLIAFLYK